MCVFASISHGWCAWFCRTGFFFFGSLFFIRISFFICNLMNGILRAYDFDFYLLVLECKRNSVFFFSPLYANELNKVDNKIALKCGKRRESWNEVACAWSIRFWCDAFLCVYIIYMNFLGHLLLLPTKKVKRINTACFVVTLNCNRCNRCCWCRGV